MLTIARCLAVAITMAMPMLPQDLPIRPLRPQASFSEPYSWVRGVAELPDGRVFVADQRELAVYLADLNSRTKLGGNGTGPKEYRAPVGIFTMRGDTAWIHDLLNRRLVAITPAGVVAPITRDAAAGEIIPAAVDTLGRLYWDNNTTIRLKKREDPSAETGAIVRYTNAHIDTVAAIKVTGPVNPGPFSTYDRWAIALDGRIAIVRNQDDYRVEWVDARGTVTNGARVNEQRIRVTNDDQSLYAQKLARREVRGGGQAQVGGTQPVRPPAVNYPDQFPYAQKVLVSPNGQAWVHRFRHIKDEEPLYDVFDARGHRIARVALPARREVIGFGRRWLYAVRIDDDGLQWLERYALPAS
ncbi:MAG: hypothetical protein ACRENP_04375 [Longimicrobiales bacterium]